jgi:hypothetical protein
MVRKLTAILENINKRERSVHMKLFLIQSTSNSLVSIDSLALIDAIGYYNFLYGHREDIETYKYCISKTPEVQRQYVLSTIPVGTIEFVQEFLKKYYNIPSIQPINIPEELNKYDFLKRTITTYTGTEDLGHTEVFVKSKDRLKGICDIMPYEAVDRVKEPVIISEVLEDIKSEWRGFVHNKKLVGLNNYLGDFTIFPDVSIINKMIAEYKNSPPSYTIDVAVCEHGTVLLEVHNFISCGLYGFNEHKLLPLMTINGWNYMLKEYKDKG